MIFFFVQDPHFFSHHRTACYLPYRGLTSPIECDQAHLNAIKPDPTLADIPQPNSIHFHLAQSYLTQKKSNHIPLIAIDPT